MSPGTDGPFPELLDRARSGDRRAVDELFARLGDEGAEGSKVLALARRILPSENAARELLTSRDLVQSALRSGWLHFQDFRGSTESEFFGWIRAILRHKLHHAVRRRSPKTGAEAAGDEAPPRTESGQDPLADMIREEVRRRVGDAVAELPEGERTVIDLRLKDLSALEIARLLGLKPETVRKRESRAMKKLRERLG